MSELVKISYRSFGGFLLLAFVFLFAASSFVFLIGGLSIIGLSFFILVDSRILETIPVMFITTRITDPIIGFLYSLLIGIITTLLGFGFYILTVKLWNYSLRLDRGLSRYIDSKLPKASFFKNQSKKSSAQLEQQDKLSKLERLTKLKEQGTVTEAEFEQEKQLILKG